MTLKVFESLLKMPALARTLRKFNTSSKKLKKNSKLNQTVHLHCKPTRDNGSFYKKVIHVSSIRLFKKFQQILLLKLS